MPIIILHYQSQFPNRGGIIVLDISTQYSRCSHINVDEKNLFPHCLLNNPVHDANVALPHVFLQIY